MWQTCSYLNSHLIKSDWKLGSLVPLVTFLRAQETPVASGHHTDGTDIEQFYHCRKFYWMLILDNPSTLRMRTLRHRILSSKATKLFRGGSEMLT